MHKINNVVYLVKSKRTALRKYNNKIVTILSENIHKQTMVIS